MESLLGPPDSERHWQYHFTVLGSPYRRPLGESGESAIAEDAFSRSIELVYQTSEGEMVGVELTGGLYGTPLGWPDGA